MSTIWNPISNSTNRIHFSFRYQIYPWNRARNSIPFRVWQKRKNEEKYDDDDDDDNNTERVVMVRATEIKLNGIFFPKLIYFLFCIFLLIDDFYLDFHQIRHFACFVIFFLIFILKYLNNSSLLFLAMPKEKNRIVHPLFHYKPTSKAYASLFISINLLSISNLVMPFQKWNFENNLIYGGVFFSFRLWNDVKQFSQRKWTKKNSQNNNSIHGIRILIVLHCSIDCINIRSIHNI